MAQVSRSGDAILVRWEEYEVDLLTGLMDEMKMLLEADIPETDPINRRLFPDAYEDPEDSRAFKDLVGTELNAGKRAALRAARASLGEGERMWSRDETEAWLTTLTDLRLAIGTRLDVTEDTMSAELDPSAPDAAAMSVLHWLGWVQESIIEAVTEEAEEGEEGEEGEGS